MLEKLKLGWILILKIAHIKNESLNKKKTIVLVGNTVNTKRQHLNLISYLEQGWVLGEPVKVEEEPKREEPKREEPKREEPKRALEDNNLVVGEYCNKRRMYSLF